MLTHIRNAMNSRKTSPSKIFTAKSSNVSLDHLSVEHDFRNAEFFIKINASKAFIEYQQVNKMIILKETEVPELFQGRGVGRLLAQAAFDYVAKNDFKMKLECTYLQHYLNNYAPEYKKYLHN